MLIFEQMKEILQSAAIYAFYAESGSILVCLVDIDKLIKISSKLNFILHQEYNLSTVLYCIGMYCTKYLR